MDKYDEIIDIERTIEVRELDKKDGYIDSYMGHSELVTDDNAKLIEEALRDFANFIRIA